MRIKLREYSDVLPREMEVDEIEYEEGMIVYASSDRDYYGWYLCKDIEADAYLGYLDEINQKGFLDLSSYTFVYVDDDDEDETDGTSEENELEDKEDHEHDASGQVVQTLYVEPKTSAWFWVKVVIGSILGSALLCWLQK